MHRRRGGAGAVVVTLGLLAAGCGGSDALTREQYSERLNAICRQVSEDQQDIGQPASTADFVAKGPRLIEVLDRALDEVRDLVPPSELRVAHRRFVEIAEELNGKLTALVEAAKAEDDERAAAIAASIDALDAQSETIARSQLGAPACAGS